jgi:hypothetical protein
MYASTQADIDKLRAAGDTAAISSEQFMAAQRAHGSQRASGTGSGGGGVPLNIDDVPVRGMPRASGNSGGGGGGPDVGAPGAPGAEASYMTDNVVISGGDVSGDIVMSPTLGGAVQARAGLGHDQGRCKPMSGRWRGPWAQGGLARQTRK